MSKERQQTELPTTDTRLPTLVDLSQKPLCHCLAPHTLMKDLYLDCSLSNHLDDFCLQLL
jgi:hypothetical protein